jgi:cytochrome c553
MSEYVFHRRFAAPLRFAASHALIASLCLFWVKDVRAADVELGRYLATECLTCHRGTNQSGTIPGIIGLDPIQVVAILRAYRSGDLPNPVMRSVSSRLKDDEIESIAEYLATVKKP